MARRAIILHQGSAGSRELRLGRILDFFAVPWKSAEVSGLGDTDGFASECAVFGSIRAVAAMLGNCQKGTPCGPCYAYLDDDRTLCVSALQSLTGDAKPSLEQAPTDPLPLQISDQLADFAGPMAGLTLSVQLTSEDGLLTGIPAVGDAMFTSIMVARDAAVFVNFRHHGASIFFCATSQVVDIDSPVGRGFYDVKDHFCSAVSLVMFIKFALREVAWRPQELSACLIIDDPLLKLNYGFCDFSKLRDLMKQNEFTTNIAFIPWNWRRTSAAAGKFFSDQSGGFSVSIHGCDHTAGEFASTSPEVLQGKALLARSRMRSHETRTGIQHDLVMVFPQGAFSSSCPEVLKRNGFMAAVNTEIAPMDFENVRTRVRDVWDVAIMTYGDFPIFTRRYPFHGLENFAFDLLLGKPCLIVTHHDFFKDGGVALVELIKGIKSLNCRLRWRPLGEVVRTACRVRPTGPDTDEVEMYGNELLVGNHSDRTMDVTIRKRKGQNDLVSEILCDEKPIAWAAEGGYFMFVEPIGSHQEKRFRVIYAEQLPHGVPTRSLRLELNVAARRILSEIGDQYLSTNRLLSAPAARMKSLLRKAI
jgi:hypothetical protein